jgi:hypothetical protein
LQRFGPERDRFWTVNRDGRVEGLDPARHLFEKSGFRFAEERSVNQWGREVIEQRFVLERG